MNLPDIGRAHWQIEYRDETREVLGKGLLLQVKNSENGDVVTLKVGNHLEIALSKLTLFRRLLRMNLYNLHIFSDLIYVNAGKFLCVFDSEGRLRYRRKLGFRIFRDGSVAHGDFIYFGEYKSNREREAVNIFRFDCRKLHLQRVWTYSEGEVRHVHQVSYIPEIRRFIVATGDVGAENRIDVFDEQFRLERTYGNNTEDYRTTATAYRSGSIFFGTDAQFGQNHFCRLDLSSGELERLAPVNGPVFFLKWGKEGLYVSSVAEKCPAVTEPYAVVYLYNGIKVKELMRQRKDILPQKLFQIGQFCFPLGKSPKIDVYPIALVR